MVQIDPLNYYFYFEDIIYQNLVGMEYKYMTELSKYYTVE